MDNDIFSNTNQNNNQDDPLLTSDPLADQTDTSVPVSLSQNTPIPPIQEPSVVPSPAQNIPPSSPQDILESQSTVSTEEIPESSPPSPIDKEQARARANELMDQGKFAEAAKILKESGIHQTKTPKPEPIASTPSNIPEVSDTTEPPVPPATPPVSDSSIPQTPPIPPAQAAPTPIPETPPEVPAPTPSPAIPPSPAEPISTPPSSPSASPEPTANISQPAEPVPAAPEPEAVSSAPPQEDSTPSSEADTTPQNQTADEQPDDYLKKAYDLRKEILEYDRSKVVEEEKLQAAEDLVFEGNKEKAIEMYKEIAREAEEKNEKEVAIEAYERLAALLR